MAAPTPFRFADQRQERIYRKLAERVGLGPAAYFRDTCRLISGDPPLEATVHFVGHAMREIESAVRAVLIPSGTAPRSQRKKAEQDKRSHSKQVEVIIGKYGLEKEPADYWLSLADADHELSLHKWAHRQTLDKPRVIDQQFVDLWSKFQSLLDIVLDKIEVGYAGALEAMDMLLQRQTPSENDLKILANKIPNNFVSHHYFFSKLQSPTWLRPLSPLK